MSVAWVVVTLVVAGSSMVVVVAVAAVVPASVVVGGASVVVTGGQAEYRQDEMFYRMVVSKRDTIRPTKTSTHQTSTQFQNCSGTP